MKPCFGVWLLLMIINDFMSCIISIIELRRNNQSWHKSRNIYKLSDPTTEYYFNQVYGQDTCNSSKEIINNIDMVYNWGNVDIILPSKSFVDNRGQFFYNNKKDDYIVYKDHEWAEVTRIGSMCLTGRWGFPRYEGFSTGLAKAGKKVLYGCWFHRYRGSGIFVNVGKTISAHTRLELMSRLHLSGCENSTNINCNRENEFCTGARKQGYDSIQVDSFSIPKNASNISTTAASRTKNFRLFYPELILCTDQCVTVTFNTSCPPGVELRTGVKGSKPCTCDDKYMTMNCGNSSDEDKQCRNKPTPYTGKRRKTCFLLGDNSIAKNPVNTNITILYLNSRVNGHLSHHHHNNNHNHNHMTANTIFDLHSAINVSGPVYVLIRSNITLSGGRLLIGYQLIEYVASPLVGTTATDKKVAVRRRNIPVVQNMHHYFSHNPFHNETGRLASRQQQSQHGIGSIQYNSSSSGGGSGSSSMYDSLRGFPLGVIAISRTSQDSSSRSSNNSRRYSDNSFHHVQLDTDIINHIIDESLCIRRSGVSIVIVMVYGRIDRRSYDTVSHQLKGYVDVILEDDHQSHKDKTEKEQEAKDKRTLLPLILPVGNNDAVNLMWNNR
eukprot:gene14418-30694_t